jgi:PEP-CTERM motif
MATLHPSRFAGIVIATALALAAALPAAANVLANPGFEADAATGNPPAPGASGWTTFGLSWTASGPAEPTRNGIGSLRLDGPGSFSVPGAFQAFPATAGQTWDLTGHMLSTGMLPPDATFGLLKIVWSDGFSFLPPGVVIIGQPNYVDYGIEALPFLDAGSAPGAWQFAQAQGVAPVGTTEVFIFALLVDQSPGTVYFDDMAAGVVPEPSMAAMMLLGLAGVAGIARRRRG